MVRVGVSINAIQRDVNLQLASDISFFTGDAEYLLLPYTTAHNTPTLLRLRLAQAQAANCTHLLFIDHDMEVPPKGPEQLLNHHKPIISGLYHQRYYPFYVIAGWFSDKSRTGLANKNGKIHYSEYCPLGKGLVEVDWVGWGCLLVEMSVFDKIKEPFRKGDEPLGYDVYFSKQVKKAGYELYVDADVSCGHITPHAIDRIYIESFYASAMDRHYYEGLLAFGDNRFSHSMERAGYELAMGANK